jgi:phospho-N-acetylmuramoyl-pentapeptide-transferase
MLYYLFYYVLHPYFSPLNVFRYITVRTAVASITALVISLLLEPWVVRRLSELQVKQFIQKGPNAIRPKPARQQWAAS